MIGIARVTVASPLTVQFFGDEQAHPIDLRDASYTPAVGELVYLLEVAEAQWVCVGKIVTG